MSISSRITSIEEHIGNAYDKLEDLGIDLTNVDKNIDNIASLLDTVYQDYPKAQGQGTEVTLDGTKVGKLSLDIKGNSTQDGTPSPTNEIPILSAGDDNLFNPNASDLEKNKYLNNGGTTGNSSVSNVSGFIEVKPNTEYKLDIASDGNKRVICLYNSSKIVVSYKQYYNTITFTTTNDTVYVRFAYYNQSTKVEFKSTVGTISEKIVNKNLAQNIKGYVTSAGKFVSSNDESFYFPVIKGQTYIYQSTGNRTISAIFNSIPVNNQEWITGTYYNPFPKNTPFVADETGIMVVYANAGSSQTVIDSFIANIGSTATTYTAHQEQTYTIPCQQPMRSIGTVRDEFVKVDGKWFERHNIKIYNITGQEGFNPMSTSSGINYFQIPNKMSDFNYIDNNASNYLCNSFKAITVNQRYIDNTIFINSGKAIVLSSNNFNSLEEIKTWLQNNPTYILYETTTPVDLPCTAEQIAILENLPKSYNEQTNIYSLDVTPAYIEAKALKGE